MGRKLIELDDEQIRQAERLSTVGLNNDQLAGYFGIAGVTWERILERQPAVKEAIEKGRAAGIGKVAASLFQMATTGKNVAAAIFFLKTRARWREIHPESPEGSVPFVLNYAEKKKKDDGSSGAE